MDEQRLRAELSSVDRSVRPDAQFADRLLERLQGEARLARTDRPARRAGRGLPRRWLAGLAFALLTVGVIGAVILAQRNDAPLACEPGLIETVRARAADAPAYAYTITGQFEDRSFPPRGPETFRVEGSYLAPGRVHQQYETSERRVLVAEAIRIGESAWHRQFPESESWIARAPHRDDFAFPWIEALPDAPALFALDGLIARAPDFDWRAAQVGDECRLVGQYVWSERNQSTQQLEIDVDLARGLPVRVRNDIDRFVLDGLERDWSVTQDFDYTTLPGRIEPPAPADVTTTPGPDDFELPARQTLSGEGVSEFDGIRLTVSQLAEVADYENSTPMPGNVFIQAHVRYEALPGRRGSLFPVWQLFIDEWLHSPYLTIPGAPGPPPHGTIAFGEGAVSEGWIVFEVPAQGSVIALTGSEIGNALLEAPVEVVLRTDADQGPDMACEPGLIETARARAAEASAYRYVVSGSVPSREALPGEGYPVSIVGSYVAPGRVHVVVELIPQPLMRQAIRVGDEVWHSQPTIPTGEIWFDRAPRAYDVSLPKLEAVPANPVLFALDGLLSDPPEFDWSAQATAAGSCRLSGRHVWSERNRASQLLTVDVALTTGLPTGIRNELDGFVHSGEDYDWQIIHEFDYSAPPALIELPHPAELAPGPHSPMDVEHPPRQRILGEGVAEFEDMVLTVSELAEVADYEGSTPMPGNVYVQAHVRFEALPGRSPSLTHFWEFIYDDWLYVPRWHDPIPGAPGPAPHSTLHFTEGSVVEGWVVFEVPAHGRVVLLYSSAGYPFSQPGVEIVLRER